MSAAQHTPIVEALGPRQDGKYFVKWSGRPHTSAIAVSSKESDARLVCAAINASMGIPIAGLKPLIMKDLLAALEAHAEHIAVHDRACCRELEAQGNAAISKAKGETG